MATKERRPTPPFHLMPTDSTLLTLEQAGQLLTISARSVHRLIEAGKLSAVRVTVGGSLRITRAEVERYIQAASFTVRTEPDINPTASADAAASRIRAKETARARVKADWNTGYDPFEDGPKNGSGAK